MQSRNTVTAVMILVTRHPQPDVEPTAGSSRHSLAGARLSSRLHSNRQVSSEGNSNLLNIYILGSGFQDGTGHS